MGATDAWPEGEPNRVSCILNMACRAELLWNFEKFMQETAAAEPLKMFVGTLELILLSLVQEIFLVKRQEFKDKSQQGFVWRRACPQDLGNCRYALLYQLLVAMAMAKKDKNKKIHFLIDRSICFTWRTRLRADFPSPLLGPGCTAPRVKKLACHLRELCCKIKICEGPGLPSASLR